MQHGYRSIAEERLLDKQISESPTAILPRSVRLREALVALSENEASPAHLAQIAEAGIEGVTPDNALRTLAEIANAEAKRAHDSAKGRQAPTRAAKGRCSLCGQPVRGAHCEGCAERIFAPGTLAEKLDRIAIAPAPAPVKICRPAPILTTNTPRCSACGDLGPCAREDGWRYDSAGLLYPCPDCGISTSEVQIAEVIGCHPADLLGGAR